VAVPPRSGSPGIPIGSPPGEPPLLQLLGRGSERGLLAILLAASLALTAAAAVSSDSVFQVDEHFQVIEFASHKLGWTAAQELPWEFGARIRPWMQPGLYYVLARGALAAGVRDPFVLVRIFRLASGVLSWAAVLALIVATRAWFPQARWRRAMFLSLTLLYFLPYLAARTSSENLSTAFLLLGLALLAGAGAGDAGADTLPSWRHLAAGVSLGLSFECRYQVAFSILGILLWLAFQTRRPWRKLARLALGLALPLCLGLWVDRWGYGAFELVPWNYFRVNVLEGKAAVFGTMPFFAYLFMLAGLFPPFGAMMLAGLVAFWWRFPRHLLTWITLPFFLGHSLVGHKEIRFMFPLLVPAALCLLLLWSRPEAVSGWMARVSRWLAAAWFARPTWALNALVLALLCFLPSSDNFGLQRYFAEHAGDPVRWVGFTDPRVAHGRTVPFFLPRHPPPVQVVASVGDLEREISRSPVPAMVAARFPLPPGAQAYLERRGERVFASLPPILARANLFHWLERADMTYVYRVAPDGR
jgi:phosphatidylinositol glycan class B